MSDMTSNDVLLDVNNLKMHFPIRAGFFRRQVGAVRAVDDVSFKVMRGETLGLVGESGCGKTTVGRCVVRAYQPTDGSIRFHSDNGPVELASMRRAELKPYRQKIRMIFQDPYSSLNPRMTVFELVSEVLRVNGTTSGKEMEDRVAYLLRRVGLRPEYMRRYPHAFSGGERQRIVIARALATNPQLIVADEAISALDVSIRAQVLNLLEDLQDEFNLTYLFIAHDLSVIRHICDRVAVMYVGKIVETADTDTLFREPRHPYTEAFLSAVPITDPRHRNRKNRIQLKGEVADPSNPPTGCYFHPRCRFNDENRCVHELPVLHMAPNDSTHAAACHYANELSLKGAVEITTVNEQGEA